MFKLRRLEDRIVLDGAAMIEAIDELQDQEAYESMLYDPADDLDGVNVEEPLFLDADADTGYRGYRVVVEDQGMDDVTVMEDTITDIPLATDAYSWDTGDDPIRYFTSPLPDWLEFTQGTSNPVFTASNPDQAAVDNGPWTVTVYAYDQYFSAKGVPVTFSVTVEDVQPPNTAPELVNNNAMTIDDGAVSMIDADYLQVTDATDEADALTYTITDAPDHGNLFIDSDYDGSQDPGELALGAGSTFRQGNIDVAELKYDHAGDGQSDAFSFTVSDDGTPPLTVAETTFTLNVTPNNSPQIVTNTGLTINENSFGVIDDSMLSATDPDDDVSILTYTLTSTPQNGVVFMDANNDGVVDAGETTLGVGSTFMHADLTGGTMTYTHNNTVQTGFDTSFGFTVKDDTSGSATGNFNIHVNDVNDPPMTDANATFLLNTVMEGGSATIDNTMLKVTDYESTTQKLTYTIQTVPATGTLFLDDGDGSMEPGEIMAAGATFTQYQVGQNKLHYYHNGEQNLTDQFTFTVVDEGGASLANPPVFSIAIQESNDAPTVDANTGLTMDENAVTTITNSMLQVTDPDADDTAAMITYSVTVDVGEGTLFLDLDGDGEYNSSFDKKLDGVSFTTFTQEDIDNGRLKYDHTDGTNPAADVTDSFTFNAEDDDGAAIAAAETFVMTISPVNDAPTANTGVPFTMDILEATTDKMIDGTLVNFDDEENGLTPANLTYTIQSLPANGTLWLDTVTVNGTYDAGEEVAVGSTFTQANVNGNSLRYDHDGAESLTETFTFVVSDNAFSMDATSDMATFTFNVINDPAADAPYVVTNETLDVTTSYTAIVSNTDLASADDDDSCMANLLYEFTDLPDSGYLWVDFDKDGSMDGGEQIVDDSIWINQEHINQNQLHYKFTDGSPTNAGIDTFSFTLHDTNYTGESAVFTIQVAGQNPPPNVITIGQPNVDEGTDVTIGSGFLRFSDVESGGGTTTAADISYVLQTIPDSGFLYLDNGDGSYGAGDTMLGAGMQFTQEDINGNELHYYNNATVGANQNFTFKVIDGEGGGALIAPYTMNITVNNINSTPFLDTNTGMGPITEDADSQTITDSMLEVTDTDDVSSYLTYTINSMSFDDSILYLDGDGDSVFDTGGTIDTELGVGSTFTQEDISDNRIILLHDGEQDTLTFTFSAQDASGVSITSTDTVFTITPPAANANDVPEVTVNTGMTTDEGIAATIDSTMLKSVDQDATDTDANLTYRLSAVPTAASGFLFIDADGDGMYDTAFEKKLVAGSTFSQNVLDGGKLHYYFSDDLAAGATVNQTFNFQVYDDEISTTAMTTFTILVSGENAPPYKPTGVTFDMGINEGAEANIANTDLQVTDDSTTAGYLTYTITDAPDDGTLFLDYDGSDSWTTPGDLALAAGSQFTQEMIDGGTLYYQHDGVSEVTDTFSFTVADDNNPAGVMTEAVFTISVTADDDSPVIATNAPVTVAEDSVITIGNTALQTTDPDTGDTALYITYTISDNVDRGSLFLDKNMNGTLDLLETYLDMGANSTFTQQDINSGYLVYDHDGVNNEAEPDSFKFTVSDDTPLTAIGTFSIYVNAGNDSPYVPATVPMQGTVNEGETLLIQNATLKVMDADDAANKLTYTLESVPTDGSLYFDTNGNNTLDQPTEKVLKVGSTFTQYQVDAGKLRYDHNVADASGDKFTFNVKDDNTPTPGMLATTTYTINVNAQNDAPTLTAKVNAQAEEGQDIVITQGNILVEDSDDTAGAIIFTLEDAPDHGTLYLDNGDGTYGAGDTDLTATGTSTFTQEDIDNGLIRYLHDGTQGVAADTFAFTFEDDGSPPLPSSMADEVFTIDTSGVNDPPVITVDSTYDASTNPIALDGGVLTNAYSLWGENTSDPIALFEVSDADAGDGSITVTVVGNSGIELVKVTETTGLDVLGGNDNALTLTGKVADINAALDTLQLKAMSGYTGNTTLDITVNDNGNTGSGGDGITTDSLVVSITGGNQPPEGQDMTITMYEDMIYVLTQDDLGYSDPEYDPLLHMRYTGPTTSDTGALTDSTGPLDPASIPGGGYDIVASEISNGEVTILTGSWSGGVFTNVQDVYGDPNNDYYYTTFTFGVEDDKNSESSDTWDLTVRVLPVNDAPEIFGPMDTQFGTPGTTLNLNAMVSADDVDAGTGNMTATLTANSGNINVGAFGTVTGNGTGTVTVNGTLSQINQALDALTYDWTGTGGGSDTITVTLNDNGNTGEFMNAKTDVFEIDIAMTDASTPPDLTDQTLTSTVPWEYWCTAPEDPVGFEAADSIESFTATADGGALPAWLHLNETSGRFWYVNGVGGTAVPGSYTIEVTATYSSGTQITGDFTLEVSSLDPELRDALDLMEDEDGNLVPAEGVEAREILVADMNTTEEVNDTDGDYAQADELREALTLLEDEPVLATSETRNKNQV